MTAKKKIDQVYQCKSCYRPIKQMPNSGRPRLYCNDACKQKYARDRRKTAVMDIRHQANTADLLADRAAHYQAKSEKLRQQLDSALNEAERLLLATGDKEQLKAWHEFLVMELHRVERNNRF